MLGHALNSVCRAGFRVGEANLRSRRAMEKIGGRLTENSTLKDTASGKVLHVLYEITRDEFASGLLAA